MSAARPFPRRVARPMAALTLALSAATLVACSGGSESSSAPSPSSTANALSSAGSSSTGSAPQAPSSSLLQAGETDFAIELSRTDLQAGAYTIEVANKGSASHDLVIEDAAGVEVAATELISPGGSGTVEVELQPGRYVFYCSVGNHRAMGVELAVTVV